MAMHATLEERTAYRHTRWADANIDGRVHWSRREEYKKHSGALQLAVQQYYCTHVLATALHQVVSSISKLPEVALELIVSFAYRGLRPLVRHFVARVHRPVSRPGSSFRLAIRKRPMLPFEVEAGETDSIGIQPIHRLVTCHHGKLDRSGRRLSMAHRECSFDWVWDETKGNADVYREVAPLVNWVQAGHDATLICYGQTGTGKTHTMTGALQQIAVDLEGSDLQIAFFEIHGKKCHDLLRDRAVVHLRSDATEQVHVRGAHITELPRATQYEVMNVLEGALKLRSVEVTERNPISSRSHAVCDIHVVTPSGATGRLRCVDLAGSERNYETVEMTPEQHRESADINTSLMALKNCFRVHAALKKAIDDGGDGGLLGLADDNEPPEGNGKPSQQFLRVPFRDSRLTRVLRDCFTDPNHRTVIIATISPTSTDLEHTIDTVNHVSYMAQDLRALSISVNCEVPLSFAANDIPVWKWTNDQVISWIASAEGGRFSKLALPAGLNGKGLLSLSAQRLGELFEGTLRRARAAREGEAWAIGVDAEDEQSVVDKLGQALFDAVRRENYRILERINRDRPRSLFD